MALPARSAVIVARQHVTNQDHCRCSGATALRAREDELWRRQQQLWDREAAAWEADRAAWAAREAALVEENATLRAQLLQVPVQGPDY